jgi:hypothetical protein
MHGESMLIAARFLRVLLNCIRQPRWLPSAAKKAKIQRAKRAQRDDDEEVIVFETNQLSEGLNWRIVSKV